MLGSVCVGYATVAFLGRGCELEDKDWQRTDDDEIRGGVE